MLKPYRTVTPTLFIFFILLTIPSPYAIPQQNDPTASTTARIVKARDYATEYVALAKDSLANTPSDLSEARKLYIKAYSSYDAWVTYMRTALEDGRTKHLGTDSEYQTIAADASASGTAFTNFVDAKTTGGTKAANVLFSSLGALGLQLWNGIADRHQQERCTASANFEEMTKWYVWEAITDDTLKNPPPSSAASSSDKCTRAASASKSSGKNMPSDSNPSSKTPKH
jgi:hypothetical protein